MHSMAIAMLASQWYWVYMADGTAVSMYVAREHELTCGDIRVLQSTQLLVLAMVPLRRTSAEHAPGCIRSALEPSEAPVLQSSMWYLCTLHLGLLRYLPQCGRYRT